MTRGSGLIVMLLGMAACGDQPTAPTAAPAPSAALTIIGPETIRTGSPTVYTAAGRTMTVRPTWTSSDPITAAVDADGSVTGRVHGSITLTATYQGATTSKTIDVVNDYGGEWAGTSIVRLCDGSVTPYTWGWATCNVFYGGAVSGAVGTSHEITLQLSRSPQDVRQMTGWLDMRRTMQSWAGVYDLDDFAFFPLKGNVANDGRLILAGGFSIEPPTAETIVVGGWDTRLSAPGEMRGGWALDFRTPAGRIYWETELVRMTRVKQQP